MAGLLLCFAVFLASVITCLCLNWTLLLAVWVGITAFFLLGLRRGQAPRKMASDAWAQGRKMCVVIVIYLLIGAITALWRSSGTIAFVIYYGLQIIQPKLFLLVSFLLTSFISYALGTSFGVIGTVGVILMALARSGGVSAAITAGTIIAGAYFGDRCSPASSSASLVAAATGTKLYDNLHLMHRTGWLPYLVTLAVYGVLSWTNPLSALDAATLEELSQRFALSLWTVIPALLIILLPLCKVSIRWTMAASAAAALTVAVLVQGVPLPTALRDAVLGYVPAPGGLHDVLSGGGVVSMLTATVLSISAGLYAGLLDGLGALNGVRRWAQHIAVRAGLFPACAAVCVLSGMVFCNQSTGAVVSTQLLRDTYRDMGDGEQELAIDIENSGIVLSPLIPWNISVSIPLHMLGVTAAAIPFAVLLYMIPLCYAATKKRLYQPRERKQTL